jgi:hypothetical protein
MSLSGLWHMLRATPCAGRRQEEFIISIENVDEQMLRQRELQGALKTAEAAWDFPIVYNLVTLMNGAVDVKSEPGKGTTFTVELPFQRMAASCPQLTAGVNKLRVPMVGDEYEARLYMSNVLERMGGRCHCVDNGEDALAQLRSAWKDGNPYNVCIVE